MELERKDLLAWQRLSMCRNLDEFRGLRLILAPELSRCFSPAVHEGQRRPYGAVIGRDDNPGGLGDLSDMANQEELNCAADGVNLVTYCAKGKPKRLLRLADPLNTQEACSALASRLDGVVVRVDAAGMIWVASSDFVTTIDDRNGWTRPSVERVAREIAELTPTADFNTLARLVRLTYSHFSPRRIGTTFLNLLTDEDNRAHQTAGESMVALGLNVRNIDDWPVIEHQLRHIDGATVVDRSGSLLRKGVMLEASQAALAVGTEGGARHNSACRHTYDRPDLLAFVVSADGPVTVFSDGIRSSALVLPDSKLPWNPSGGEMWTNEKHCPNCGVKLTVRKTVLYGLRTPEEGNCPICKAEAASVHGWQVEIGLIKDAISIERIREFRRGEVAHG